MVTTQCEDAGGIPKPAKNVCDYPKVLSNGLKEAQGLQEAAKTKLVELYRKALSNLEKAKANAQRTTAFEEATQTAPAQTQLIRQEIEAAKDADPVATLDVSIEDSLEQLEQRLQKEQADLDLCAGVVCHLARHRLESR